MTIIIPARQGAYVLLEPSQRLKIINPSGHQVVDTWAFSLANTTPAWMSMAQTRSKLMKLRPAVGDVFVDQCRQPVLQLGEDSSDGVHDMIFPACDERRYAELGVPEHHSCMGNLRVAMGNFSFKYGYQANEDSPAIATIAQLAYNMGSWDWTPEPLNLFMNVPWTGQEGSLEVKRPQCKAGDYVVLKALVRCLVVMSACPNDVADTNAGKPGHVEYEVLE